MFILLHDSPPKFEEPSVMGTIFKYYVRSGRKSQLTLNRSYFLTPFFPPYREDFVITDSLDNHDAASADDQGKRYVEDDFPCLKGGGHDSVRKALVSGKADEIINRMQNDARKGRTRNNKQCAVEEAVQAGYKCLSKSVGYGSTASNIHHMHDPEDQSGDDGQQPDFLFCFDEPHRDRNYGQTKYAFFPETSSQCLYDIKQGRIKPEVVHNQLRYQHCNSFDDHRHHNQQGQLK